MDILVRAFRFMQSNGPEWVLPHIVFFAFGFSFHDGSETCPPPWRSAQASFYTP